MATKNIKQCNIQYIALDDNWRKEQKLQWFAENPLKNIAFEHIQPDKNNNWINIADNDFENLLPLADKAVKAGKSKKALFELFSLGIATNRDEWVYDYDKENLENKINFFSSVYDSEKERWQRSNKKTAINDFVNRTIKWTEELETHLKKGTKFVFNEKNIQDGFYRPFVKKNVYFDRVIIHRPYQQPEFFPIGGNTKNPSILTSIGGRIDYAVFSTDCLPNLAVYSLDAAQCLTLYQYDKEGTQIENITDWGLNQFTKQYGKKGVTKEAIFHYVYAVLHNPTYRKKYELNLKREFPRIPFYKNFEQWANWGKQLMDLHINYETVEPFALEIEEILIDLAPNANFDKLFKAKLKADKINGIIEIDAFTTIKGIPKQAWEYKLGNRSALEWVLDQYKESKPKDPTIAEKFNTYKFADYKDQVLDLLKKVCTVSVETMKIVGEMEKINE